MNEGEPVTDGSGVPQPTGEPDEAYPWQQREEVDLDLHGAPTWDPTQYGPPDDDEDSTAAPRRFRLGRPRPSPSPRPARHGRAPGVPSPMTELRQQQDARLADEQAEAERAEAERADAERARREQEDAERRAAALADRERREAERAEAERAEAERAEAERLEAERAEAARLEAERLEAERAEAARLQAARLAAERAAAARSAAARAAEAAALDRATVAITDDDAVDLLDDTELPPRPTHVPSPVAAAVPPPAVTPRPAAVSPVAPPEPVVERVSVHKPAPPAPRAVRPSPFVNPMPAADAGTDLAPLPGAAPTPQPADPDRDVAGVATPPGVASPVDGDVDTSGGAKPERRRSGPGFFARHRRSMVSFIVVVLVAGGVATALRLFVVQTYYIPSASMEPTLHGCPGCTDDHVLVDKLSYHFTDVHVGDVVVFNRPPAATGIPDDVLIKRVVALGGDTITLKNDRVFVNGLPDDENYLDSAYLAKNCPGRIAQPETSTTTWKIPAGDVFVMGDNRCNSDDSRTFGPITTSSIIGRAILIIWPFSRFGSI